MTRRADHAALLVGGLLLTGSVSAMAEAPQAAIAPFLEALGLDAGHAGSLELSFSYAFVPPHEEVLNPELTDRGRSVDLWGQNVPFSADRGAVPIDAGLLALGRDAFYRESFGNEWFFTDVVGLIDGPITLDGITAAIRALDGAPTDNLRVRLAAPAVVGGREFAVGEEIATGLDVPRGALAPLGVKVSYADGRAPVGVSCSLCHSAVDPVSGKVVHGATNPNLQLGLLLALAPNSAAYFTHTGVADINALIDDEGPTVIESDGSAAFLPDPDRLEDAVDRTFLSWPPGTFDSSLDLVANPTMVPDSFTFGEQPFGWTGFAMAGPFNGLSVLNNAVHAVNSDPLAQAPIAGELFGIDPERYLAILLRNAAAPEFRWDPIGALAPSEVLAKADPHPGAPGVNTMIMLPTHPRPSLVALDGLLVSPAHRPVWEQVNAIAAFQDGIVAPPPPLEVEAATRAAGREVFERAGCQDCHGGPRLTDNRIRPATDIGTNPSRAAALAGIGQAGLQPAELWPFDTPVPIPDETETIAVPTDHLEQEQIRLAWALDGKGGYKTPGLVGLWWTVPYLHDGGVAAGADPEREVGLPGTLLAGVRPDPRESLRALLDRELRARVVRANAGDPGLRRVNVEGVGHEFWVDEAAGFAADEQEAIIAYLLTIDEAEEAARAARR